MVETIAFTEPRIRGIRPPLSGRTYYKDSGFQGLQVAVFPSGSKVFYLVRRTSGRPTRHRLGTSEQLSVIQARAAAAAIAGKIAIGENPQTDRRRLREEPTLEKLHQHWMLYANSHKKATSAKEDKRLFERLCSELAKRRLGTIRKTDIQALHADIGLNNGPYAANRLLALLRSMFNQAMEIGYRGDNPAKGVKMFKEESRDRFLQIGELEAFFGALEQEPQIFKDYFLMLLLTGARKSNVLMMRWDAVDLTTGCWRIAENKSGSVVMVPLVGPAVELLLARKEASNGSPWVFPGHKVGAHLTEPDKAWARIRTAAKLEDLRIHDLRRSLGSWMAGQNTSLTIIGKVLGHKTPQATAVYARLSMDPQRLAMENATSAMLLAGKQTKQLTIDVKTTEVIGEDDE